VALSFVFKARARGEIEKAAAWWAENRPAAPGAVRKDIGDGLRILIEQPGIGTQVETGRVLQVRRFFLGRTRYFLYYRVRGDVLEVISLWHSSREQGPKV
jgi:plasmid stabilization system protein ParE